MKKGIYIKMPFSQDKKKLKQLIAEAGFTPTTIARALGVTYKTVYRWLNKGVSPHPVQCRAIDALFKENVDMVPIVYAAKKRFSKNPLKVLKQNAKIRNKFIIEMTYHSNALCGSQMTLKEIEQTIKGEVVKGKTLYQLLEVINQKNAINYILDSIMPGFKITKNYILELHSIIMYNFNDKLPGKYRNLKEVPIKMMKLFKTINSPKPPHSELTEKTVCIHYDFKAIHPFCDGNGRVARLLMATQLLMDGFAPAIITLYNSQRYYTALEKWGRGECRPLIQITCEAVLKGYNLLLDNI